MKPLKLKLKGINSFIEEQVIDFEKLTHRGLFGIFGPTGSGKTTILDGITLSLYGKVARDSSNFINTNVDLLQVSFEFQISTEPIRRYRAEREFRRDKTGSMRTKSAKILDITDDVEMVLEESVRLVTSRCEEIIGLNIDDFTRTVVLPQGKFSEFLKLQGKERREMLERLFHLEKYGDELSQKLGHEIRTYKDMEIKLDGQLIGYEEVDKEILEAKQKEYVNIQTTLEKCEKEKKKIEEDFQSWEKLWRDQEEYQNYQEQLTELKEQEKEIDEKRKNLALGESANYIKSDLDQYESIQNQMIAVRQRLEEQNARFQSIKQDREKRTKEYESIKLEKEQNLPKLQEKGLKLRDGIQLEKDKLSLVQDKKRLEDEISSLLIRIHSLEDQESKLNEEVNKRKNQIAQKEDEALHLRISPEYKRKLMDVKTLYEQMKHRAENINKTKNQLKFHQEEADKSQKSYNELQEKANEIGNLTLQLREKLNTLMEASPGDQSLIANEKIQLNDLQHKWNRYGELSKSLKDKRETLQSVEQEFEVKSAQNLQLSLEIDEVEQNLKVLSDENHAHILRESLREGAHCPVCGSTEHQLDGIVHRDLSELNGLRELLDKQKLTFNKEALYLKGLEVKRDREKDEIKKVENEIEVLGHDFLQTPYETVEKKFQSLQKSIQDYEKKREILENELNAQKDHKNKLDNQLSGVHSSLISSVKQIEKCKEELEGLKRLWQEDQAELNKYKLLLNVGDIPAAFKELQEKEKKGDDLSNDLNRLRKIDSQKTTEKENLLQRKMELQNNHVEKKASLFSTEKGIVEKVTSIIEKVGSIDDLSFEYKKVMAETNRLTEKFTELEQKKISIDQVYDKLNDEIKENQNNLLNANKYLDEVKGIVDKKMIEKKFESIYEVREHLLNDEEIKTYKSDIEDYQRKVNKISGALESIKKKIDGRNLSPQEWEKIKEDKHRLNEEYASLQASTSELKAKVTDLVQKLEVKKNLSDKKKKITEKLGLLNDLESLFKGKRFVEYVATHQLQYISLEASNKLKEITGGNYGLEVDENGKFMIRDYKNGGALRDASTLSGGETFLASLALALALSAQIQLKGTAPLELFFLDEGFGTLDDELLEIVMESLETLHHETLSIGIISHVESIKNRVPIKLMIEPAVSGLGGSKVKIEYS